MQRWPLHGSEVAGCQDGSTDLVGDKQEDSEMELGFRNSKANLVKTMHIRRYFSCIRPRIFLDLKSALTTSELPWWTSNPTSSFKTKVFFFGFFCCFFLLLLLLLFSSPLFRIHLRSLILKLMEGLGVWGLFVFMAAPAAYGSSQARAQTGAAAEAYATATATPDASCICNLCHSLQQH